MAYTELIRSLLNDARTSGPIVIEKRKLLWLLGWGQDRGGAWTDLLMHWHDIGEDQSTLIAAEIDDKIVLSKGPVDQLPEVVRVVDAWAD